jgi:hypothetical protein
VLRDTLGQERRHVRRAAVRSADILSLTRTVASGNHGRPVRDEPGRAELTDVVVRDTSAQTSDGLFGSAYIVDGSLTNVTRTRRAEPNGRHPPAAAASSVPISR